MRNRFEMTEEVFKALKKFGNHCVREYQENENRMKVAENSDWKILDENCLPEKWWESGRYKYKIILNGETDDASDLTFSQLIYNTVELDCKYHYRPTKTKKSDEEYACRYIDGEHLYKTFFPVKRIRDFDEMIKDNVRRSFIAGRKSVKDETGGEI